MYSYWNVEAFSFSDTCVMTLYALLFYWAGILKENKQKRDNKYMLRYHPFFWCAEKGMFNIWQTDNQHKYVSCSPNNPLDIEIWKNTRIQMCTFRTYVYEPKPKNVLT